MNARRIGADLVVFGKGYVRNPLGLFFSILFPLILIGLFGLIFSTSAASKVTLYTDNLDGGSNASAQFLDALNRTGAVTVELETPQDPGNFSTWLAHNDHPAGLVIPAGFGTNFSTNRSTGLVLYTNPQDPASGGAATAAVEAVSNQFNLDAAHGTVLVYPTFQTVGGLSIKYIDYLVPGLIGFSILTNPMFAMVDITASYRKDHLFRQLSLTPLTKGEWLVAKIVWYILLTFLSAATMIVAGTLLFGAQVTLTLGLVPFLILGPFFFVSLGMLAGSAARSPETAAVIGNIVTFPMMFLSGTFFPVSGFSPALQAVAHALPLYYIIDGMNQVMLYNNTASALADFGLIAVGSAVIFIAAIWVFRWRDE